MNWGIFLMLGGLAVVGLFCRGIWRPAVILVASILGGVILFFTGSSQAEVFIIPAVVSVLWLFREYINHEIPYPHGRA